MAQLKNTTINDTGFVQLPVGSTAQRPSSPQAGQLRYNSTLNFTEWYDDQLSDWFPTGRVSPSATGGTVTNVTINNANYRVHTFNNDGTFTVDRAGVVEYLIVAGGGAGGASRNSSGGGGGGGGGGVLIGSAMLLAGDYPVEIGAGGAAPTADTTAIGGNGKPSTFAGYVAAGGGAGGNGYNDAAASVGRTGASGGGGGYRGYTNQGNGGIPILGQGFQGGGVISGSASGGGGGGAGGPGFTNGDTGGGGGIGGLGGFGIYINFDGTLTEYGRGGQGGSGSSAIPANRGTGGRGAYAAAATFAGGSGIVIARYRTN